MELKPILVFIVVLAFGGTAQAQTKWDMPTPYSDGEFHTINVRQFAEDVKKASGGQVDINVHSNGSLIKHPDILRAVSTGQVAMGEFLLGQFGNEEAVFNADNVPFLAVGFDNAFKLYQAQKSILQKKLEGRGMQLLYAVAWPGQGFYSKNELKSIEDLKGAKMRTYSPMTARLVELLGASPLTIQVPEVPQAFATGTMTAMVTSSATGASTKAWEFVKNYYTTSAWHPKNVVVVNSRAFQGLNAAQKKAITDAAAAAEKRGWELGRARETNANKLLADNGMAVHAPTPAMMTALAKIGETMSAEWLKSAGADGEAIVKAYRGK
ncbi:MAG: C4-dicarboxylate ABC transporter substrate-binding protein [Betaproteobacteria bacterium]|nr:C4-dicarboxylate ABC transporter substrate-binding protein [Betaproteobacteria bacterium]